MLGLQAEDLTPSLATVFSIGVLTAAGLQPLLPISPRQAEVIRPCTLALEHFSGCPGWGFYLGEVASMQTMSQGILSKLEWTQMRAFENLQEWF